MVVAVPPTMAIHTSMTNVATIRTGLNICKNNLMISFQIRDGDVWQRDLP
jgi:hypothetical protein